MIPKSRIKASLTRKFMVKDVDSRLIAIVGTDPKRDLETAKSLLDAAEIPYTFNDKSSISAYGTILVERLEIVAIPKKIKFVTPTGLGTNNPAVQNRLSFAHLIHQVMLHTAKPFNIIFAGNKRVQIKGVTNIKFLGESIADLRIMQGNTKVRVTVNMLDGVYHTEIKNTSVQNIAHDALVEAAQSGILNATIDDNDNMELHQPVVMKAPRVAIRELITSHIRGGVGVVGTFTKNSAIFDGNTNTVLIKCDRVFKTEVDLKPDDEPYLVVSNSPTESLFDLKGLTIDLVPKRNLPVNSTVINI